MKDLREVGYQEFKRMAQNPPLRFIPPILRTAGDNYFIMSEK